MNKKVRRSPTVSVEDILWKVYGKKFKCFKVTDDNLTHKGEDVLDQLIDILHMCQEFGFKNWKNMNIDGIESEIEEIVRRGY